MNLTQTEIDYLKLFLKIVDEKGVYSLVESCQSHNFAMYPFVSIIEKIVNE